MYMVLTNDESSYSGQVMIGTVLRDQYLPSNQQVRKVTIHYDTCVLGFNFHFTSGSNTLKIGSNNDMFGKNVDLVLDKDEVIVGFKAKELKKDGKD